MSSYSWDQARKDVGAGNVERVLSLIGKGVPNIRGRRRLGYPFKLSGQQRRGRVRGEGVIEERLLGKQTLLIRDGAVVTGVRFLANAAGLGSRKKGNVVADLFGLDTKNSPVVGEVKVTHGNPWYAVVECAEQVALVRADRKNLASWLRKELKIESGCVGAWGMVIAPETYWCKQETAAAKKLLDALRRTTEIRICCVSYPGPKSLKSLDANLIGLKVVCGMPPST